MKRAMIAAGALLLTAVTPSAACDPETMHEQMAELCRVPFDELKNAIGALAARNDVGALVAELDRARFACGDGRYEDGIAIAMLVSRRIGRMEAMAAKSS